MIGGHVAMLDQLDVDAGWHLVDVDVAVWPMYALCGRRAPRAMQRDVKRAGDLAVDEACPACLSAAARGGQPVERRAARRVPGVGAGGIAVAFVAPLTALGGFVAGWSAWSSAVAGGVIA